MIPQDTAIGIASPVDVVSVISAKEDIHETNNFETIRQIKLDPSSQNDISGPRCTEEQLVELERNIPDHLIELFNESDHDRSSNEAQIIADLLTTNEDVFSQNDLDLGLTHLTEHVIDTQNAVPVKQRARPVPMAFANEDKIAVEKLLEQGSIQPSTSPWSSPMVFVRKKSGEVRPCVDYRKLNLLSKKDAFPLPRTQDCLDAVAGAKLFASLDITSAYNQIPVRTEDIPKTAFVTKYGLFEYTTMPFGLSNAPATFQRLMEIALSGLQWTTCLIYLDDVLLFGSSFQELTSRIQAVLDRIRAANLKLKPSKCHLFREEVTFLGHILSPDGIRPNKENIEKILQWKAPTNVKEVQSFLGMANYYRRFCKNYSALVRPLIDLTMKGKKFEWTEKCS